MAILVSYCTITNYHKLSASNNIHLFHHSSTGQESRHGSNGSSAPESLTGYNQGAGQAAFIPGAHGFLPSLHFSLEDFLPSLHCWRNSSLHKTEIFLLSTRDPTEVIGAASPHKV